jgi:hypothetical protein
MNDTHRTCSEFSSGASEGELVLQTTAGETFVPSELLQQLRRARAAAIEAARRARLSVAE